MRWTMLEFGLPFDSIEGTGGDRLAELKAVSPLGKVPAIVRRRPPAVRSRPRSAPGWPTVIRSGADRAFGQLGPGAARPVGRPSASPSSRRICGARRVTPSLYPGERRRRRRCSSRMPRKGASRSRSWTRILADEPFMVGGTVHRRRHHRRLCDQLGARTPAGSTASTTSPPTSTGCTAMPNCPYRRR